jgi:hypothetical protein
MAQAIDRHFAPGTMRVSSEGDKAVLKRSGTGRSLEISVVEVGKYKLHAYRDSQLDAAANKGMHDTLDEEQMMDAVEKWFSA